MKNSEGAGAQVQLYSAVRIPGAGSGCNREILENTIAVNSIQIILSLKDIYEGVSFG